MAPANAFSDTKPSAVDSYTKPINLSKKVRTGQFVEAEREHFQCRAEAEFRRNVACAARRSLLDVGTLVYQIAIKRVLLLTVQLILVEVKVFQLGELPNLRRDSACQRISRHKTLSGRLIHPSRNLSTNVLTSQPVPLQLEVLHSRAAPQLRRDCTCAARRSF